VSDPSKSIFIVDDQNYPSDPQVMVVYSPNEDNEESTSSYYTIAYDF